MNYADLAGRVLFEDNHLIAVNKRPGEISQGDKTGDPSLLDDLAAFIKERDAKPGKAFVGLVHRLDRPTSGLMLFAKTSKALERLNRGFQERSVEKAYLAIVEGSPAAPEAELVHWLSRDTGRNKAAASDRPGPGLQEARLSYRTLSRGERYSLLWVDLHTGRHHQIRAQLKAVGLCIKGDLKYGAARSNPDGGICLHSVRLAMPYPVGQDRPALELWADPRQVQAEKLWELLLTEELRLHFSSRRTTVSGKTGSP